MSVNELETVSQISRICITSCNPYKSRACHATQFPSDLSECANVNELIKYPPTPAIIGLSKPFFDLSSADFFQNQLVQKIISIIRFVGPDLGQSCLQKLSADDSLSDKELKYWEFIASKSILCKNNTGDTLRVMWQLIRVHTYCNKLKKINEVAQFYYDIQLQYKMSHCMWFPTMLYVRPAKPQISLRIRSLIRAFASRLSILWLLSYWLNTIWSF